MRSRRSSLVQNGCFMANALRIIGTLSNEAIPALSKAPRTAVILIARKKGRMNVAVVPAVRQRALTHLEAEVDLQGAEHECLAVDLLLLHRALRHRDLLNRPFAINKCGPSQNTPHHSPTSSFSSSSLTNDEKKAKHSLMKSSSRLTSTSTPCALMLMNSKKWMSW